LIAPPSSEEGSSRDTSTNLDLLSSRPKGMWMLRWTGEQILPTIKDAATVYQHVHRYVYASEFVRGKRVLDLMAGEAMVRAFSRRRRHQLLASSLMKPLPGMLARNTRSRALRSSPAQSTFRYPTIPSMQLFASMQVKRSSMELLFQQ
jgi:hypothetical protein